MLYIRAFLDFFEIYLNVLIINYTYKINKYNLFLCIFNQVTTCNKYFFIGFALLHYEDKNLYFWLMTQIQELYVHVRQENRLEVMFINKNNVFIGGFAEVISTSYYILYIWHIIKNLFQ